MRINIPKTQFVDFKFRQDNGQGREPIKGSRGRATKSASCYVCRFKRGGDRRHGNRNYTESEHGETGIEVVECCVTGGCQ